MGQWDMSVGKGACFEVWQPDLIPGTHMVKGKGQFLQIFLWPPHMHCGMCIHTHTPKVCTVNIALMFSKNMKVSIAKSRLLLQHLKDICSEHNV